VTSAVTEDGRDLADPATVAALGEVATRYGIEMLQPEQV